MSMPTGFVRIIDNARSKMLQQSGSDDDRKKARR